MVHVVTFPHARMTAHTMWMNLNVHSFQAVIAIFVALTGIFGLFDIGLNNRQFAEAMGSTISNVFNVGYVLAGLGILVGLALNRRDVELFGLVCVITSLFVRSSALLWYTGINPITITGYSLNLLLVGAAVTRAYLIYKYKFVVQKIVESGHNHVA